MLLRETEETKREMAAYGAGDSSKGGRKMAGWEEG